MAISIGIFEKEEDVLEAIRLLREAGVDQDEIRVVVNNREGAPMLASDGNVNIEELYRIESARSYDDDGSFPLGVVPIAAGYPVGSTSVSSSGPSGVILAGLGSDDVPDSERILRAIGIPSQSAEQCGHAIENGKYVLVSDADSDINSQSLLKHAGADVLG
jgi:hypothetical protein